MAHLNDRQKARLVSYRLSRNGIDLAPTPANVQANACWAWALLGTQDTSVLAEQPGAIIDRIFTTDYEWAGENVVVNVTGVNDLRDEIADTGAHFDELADAYGQENNRRNFNQNPISLALMKILATLCGLTPSVHPRPDYVLYMNATNWHAWDHWGLGIRRGDLISIVQTVTGVPLAYGCDRLWDEHLPVKCWIGLQGLHQSQVDTIGTIPAPARDAARCLVCGSQHGAGESLLLRWHRCTACGVIYCYSHGWQLGGKLGLTDQTRACGVPGCGGRTELF